MARKFILVLAFVMSFVSLNVCYAFRLLTKEQALEKVFGKDCQITTETKELVGPKLSTVKERLGGELVHYQSGSKSAHVSEAAKVDFYIASKGGQQIGAAIIDTEPGKWGPVEFIIALNPDGSVKQVEVMDYKEKRGRPIARRSFMGQYTGKTSKDKLQVGKDISGISGATISSNCATFAVKKAIVLFEEFYLR